MNAGTGRIGLVPPSERKRSQSEIVKDISKKLVKYNNLRIFPIEEQTIAVGMGSRGSLPVQYVIQNLDFDKLKDAIPKFLEAARNDKTFQNVDVNLKFNKPEVDIIIDRIKARELGLTVSFFRFGVLQAFLQISIRA